MVQQKKKKYQRKTPIGKEVLEPKFGEHNIDVMINFENIKKIDTVAQTSKNAISKAEWDGHDVRLQEFFLEEENTEEWELTCSTFLKECKALQNLKHPNVVSFYGACSESVGTLAFISEDCSNGTLHEILHSANQSKKTIPNEKLWTFAHDIIQGILYLHSRTPSVIHGNLNSNNILIDSNDGAKLSNFGISILEKTAPLESSAEAWMSPEQLIQKSNGSKSPLSTKSVIWSFGCILVELFGGSIPWKGISSSDIKEQLLKGASPPEKDIIGNQFVRKLIDDCLSHDPELRPNTEEILALIENEVFGEGDEEIFCYTCDKQINEDAGEHSIYMMCCEFHLCQGCNTQIEKLGQCLCCGIEISGPQNETPSTQPM